MNSKKVQMYLMHEGDEGLSLRLTNGRWINVYTQYNFNPDTGEFGQVWYLNAGDDMMPADYFETHETIESLVASMRELRDLRSWQPSSLYYTE